MKGIVTACVVLRTCKHEGMIQQLVLIVALVPLQADTTTLFLYATLRMMPSSLSQAPRSRSSSRRENPAAGPAGLLASNLNNALGPSRLRNLFTNLTTSPSSDVVPNPHISDAHDSSVDDQGTRSSVPRPLVHEGWWRDADNFLCTDAWGSETGRSKMLPNVTLRQSEERLNLCVYQFRSLTLVMLVPKSGGSDLIPNLQGQLLEKVRSAFLKCEIFTCCHDIRSHRGQVSLLDLFWSHLLHHYVERRQFLWPISCSHIATRSVEKLEIPPVYYLEHQHDWWPMLMYILGWQAAHKIQKLEEKVVKEWPGSNAWHVAGYRYLYNDSNNKVSRFSPASKVATLSLVRL